MSIASIGPNFCERVRVYVPQHGAWYADVLMIGAPALSGEVTLALGTLDLVGTVVSYGTRGEQAFAKVVGGAGAWGATLPAKPYHNDAGVKAKLVAEDAARECGETLETLTTQERLGSHFVRRIGPASRTLELSVGRAWHVGYDGVTRVGERASHTPAEGVYTVVDVQPEEGVVTLSLDDLGAVVVGSVLSEGLDVDLTVRDMEIRVDAEEAVIVAWCGGTPSTQDRISSALSRLVERESGERIYGKWRYRVVEMDGDRVKLQAISSAAGLPDILPVDMYPGLAGVHAVLTNSAEVLVEFVEGSPSLPIITGFVGKGGSGFVPVSLTLDATSEIKLGASASDFVALATKVNTEIDRIWTHLQGPLSALTGDGGATLWTNQIAAAEIAAGLVQDVDATMVKAE